LLSIVNLLLSLKICSYVSDHTVLLKAQNVQPQHTLGQTVTVLFVIIIKLFTA